MINLKEHEKKIFSQKGEDGIIEKIFDELKIKNGHCVELGAWDGVKYSNVYHLIKNKNWSATMIEADEEKYGELVENMEEFNVKSVKKMVTLEEDNNLNNILKSCDVNKDFDLLSLDLDGCDYWIWHDLKFEPKVVIVEYNSNWEKDVTIKYDPKHFWDGTQYYGASGSALNKLAESKGYELIAHVPNANLIFIKKELNNGKFEKVDITNNIHVSKNHHKPMSEENTNKLVYNPPTN